MLIFPAIDIFDGKVVRLEMGNYSAKKTYSGSPLEIATEFYKKGARNLHVVDLDGARSGTADNSKIIEKIVTELNMFVEVGGGIRTFEQIEKYRDCGVKRIILGTAAVSNCKLLEKAIKCFGDLIAVGVDAKNNKVAINGWEEITQLDSIDFCRKLKQIGVNNVIYTDIRRDGMLKGANLKVYDVLCQTYIPKITASGGISDINELIHLKKIGIYGAILGKSIYENRIDLCEAVKICEDKNDY